MTRRKGLLPFFAALVVLAAVSAARAALPSGLRAQYFLGSEFIGPPARTTLDSSVSSLRLSRRWDFKPPEAFSAQWSGFFFANREGLYAFSIVADDGSRLYVDQRPVIQESGQGPGERTGQIRLERGAHAILLQYVQLGGPYRLEWTVSRDGGAPDGVPGWALSPRARGAWGFSTRRVVDWVWLLAIAAVVERAIHFLYSPSYWAYRRATLREDPAAWGVRSVRPRMALAALIFFVALASAETWPLVMNPAHLSRNDNADTMLNEWTVAWVAHQLPRNPLRVFEANIFHPDPHTLAYSEPLITHGAMGAPLFWLGASPVLVYNVLLLAGFILTAWTMSLIVARWTGDWAAGLVAGVLVAFNGHTLTRLPHLQAQHGELLPIALLVLDALLRRPSWLTAIALAGVFLLQALTSVYLLVFTAVATAMAVIVRPEDWLGPPFRTLGPKLGVSLLMMLAAVLPVLWPYWQLHLAGFERSLDEVAFFSARGADYLTTPSRLHGWLGTTAHGSNSLFPGCAALALAVFGLAQRRRGLFDRRVRMAVAIGVAGVILSFGPFVPGYPVLSFLFPPLQAVRASARFGYLGLFAVAIAAAYGLAAIRRRFSARPAVMHAVSAGVVLMVVTETFVAPFAYQRFTEVSAIYGSPEAATANAVADLPFPPPDAVFRNAPFMLGSTRHFKPTPNGYSGFIPPSYFAHHVQLAGFPDEASLAALESLGVTHVFVHRDAMEPAALDRLAASPRFRQVEVEGPIALYRLEP
jgi:hypothetical protein